MSDFVRLQAEIDRGRENKNQGLPTGLGKLDQIIYNVQPESYYLVGAETSTGKTAFVDFAFVLNPLHFYLSRIINEDPNYQDLDFRVDYFSLEVSKNKKLIKWIANYMYHTFNQIYDINFILSKGKNRISQEVYDQVLKCQEYIDTHVGSHIFIHDEPINPTGIYKHIENVCASYGQVQKTVTKINNYEYHQNLFIPNSNRRIIHLVVVDHVGLLSSESDLNKKGVLDRFSKQMITIRNRYRVSPVLISQFNRSLAEIDRKRFTELRPQLNDFKDTGNLAEDAEFVFSLFNPVRYNLAEYQGYQLNDIEFASRLRFLQLLKNRDGIADVAMALNFLGETGNFRDIPVEGEGITQDLYTSIKNYTKF